jgi:hypothetical protein
LASLVSIGGSTDTDDRGPVPAGWTDAFDDYAWHVDATATMPVGQKLANAYFIVRGGSNLDDALADTDRLARAPQERLVASSL